MPRGKHKRKTLKQYREIGKRVAKAEEIEFGSEEEKVMRELWEDERRKVSKKRDKLLPKIEDLYYKKEMSLREVSKKLRIDKAELIHFMDLFGLPRREDWKGMSKQGRKKVGKKTWGSKTEKEKEDFALKMSKSTKKVWDSRTPKEKEDILAKAWKRETPRKKERTYWDDKTTKQRKIIMEGRLDGVPGFSFTIKIPKKYKKEYNKCIGRLVKGADPEQVYQSLRKIVKKDEDARRIVKRACAEAAKIIRKSTKEM